MFELKVENKYGEVLTLSQNPNYAVKSIDGIDPPDAVINTARNANADGSVFNSAYVDNRTITITLAINQPTEANRIALYKYFKSKYPVAIYFKNDSRDVMINGYVQSIPIGYFEKKEIFQVTIFCPEPFFEGVEKEAASSLTAEALFEFPFDISVPIPFSEQNEDRETLVMNEGDVETGALFKIHAIGNVVNPAIVNVDTNERFAFNITLQQSGRTFTCVADGTGNTDTIGSCEWYLDGEKQEILPSAGMMLLKVPAGEHRIEFTYVTPGDPEGKAVSLAACAAFAAWLLFRSRGSIIRRLRRKA